MDDFEPSDPYAEDYRQPCLICDDGDYCSANG
jgi:hypothetical protein